jgi:hypothetical protein
MELILGACIAGVIGFVVGHARGRRRTPSATPSDRSRSTGHGTYGGSRSSVRDRDYGGLGSLGAMDDWGDSGPG